MNPKLLAFVCSVLQTEWGIPLKSWNILMEYLNETGQELPEMLTDSLSETEGSVYLSEDYDELIES